MHFAKTTLLACVLAAAAALPAFAQEAAAGWDPNGSFVDSYGTSFTFSLCGEGGQDLCGTLTTLKGESATEENLAYVGKQVMQATRTGPNEWKGSISSGSMSADVTVTMTGPDTIEIQGCRAAILCQTLAYNRA